MIYVDTSVILAQLFAEDRVPPVELWEDVLVSSRLAVYETWRRVHARRLGSSHGEQVRLLFGRIALVELVPPVLARAIEPFPSPVRTLDALHLASIDFLRAQSQSVTIATYDERLRNAAAALGVSIYPL